MNGPEIRRHLRVAIKSLIQVVNDPEHVPLVLEALNGLRDLDVRLEREHEECNAPDSGERFYLCLTAGLRYLSVLEASYPSLETALAAASAPVTLSACGQMMPGICASRRRLGVKDVVYTATDPEVRIISHSKRVESQSIGPGPGQGKLRG